MSVWVDDLDAARDFYTEKLGFEDREDVTMGAKGAMGAGGLGVADCRKTYAELVAKGVTFLAEPADPRTAWKP